MKRRTFIRNAGIAGGMMAVSPLMANFQVDGNESFPLMDLHVHLTTNFTIDNLMEISKATKVPSSSYKEPIVASTTFSDPTLALASFALATIENTVSTIGV